MLGSTPQVVKVIDLAMNSVAATIPMGTDVTDIAPSSDGARVYVLCDSTVRTIDTASNTVVDSQFLPSPPVGLSVSPINDRVYVVMRAGNDSLRQFDAALTTLATVTPLASQNSTAAGPFLSPIYITGSFPVSSDSDFDGVHIDSFINLHGGTLNITSSWTTTRTISVLSGGGTINMNGYVILGATRGNGVLTLTGPLAMEIGEPGHTGGTVVANGSLVLLGGAPTHSAPITVSGGVLAGSGSASSINATSGAISPGNVSAGNSGIIQATNLTLSSSASYIVDLNANTGPGAGHDQLDVTGSAVLNDAQLTIRLNFDPTGGTQFTIVKNASGTFNGLPEGTTFFAGAQRFRIMYQGGDGNDVVLTADDAPGSSTLGPQTISENRVMGPIDFTVSDDLTPAGSLLVSATSSNQTLLTNANIAINGTGATRSISATPVALEHGQTTITVSIDDGANVTQIPFVLTVTADDPPTLTPPANQTMKRDTVLGPIAFTIGDDLTGVNDLNVTATSSNNAVVMNSGLAIGGTGASRTLTITPAPLAVGATTITLRVTDEFSQETEQTFTLDVTLDDPPTITGPGDVTNVRGTPVAPITLTIGDDLIPPAALTVTASSSNVLLVRNEDVVLGGTGVTRTMTLTAQPRAIGSTTITANVFDGVHTTPYTFMLTVNKDNAPTINGPTDRTAARGSAIGPIEFTIADDFIPVEELTVTAVSSNTAVVRTEDIVLGGTGATRTMAIAPMAGALGTTTITLTVADDLSSATHTFDLEIFEQALTYYLSEGSTGAFFDTDLLLANPNDAAVPVTIEFLLPDGAPITLSRELAATSRTTIRADEIEGLESAAFSTVVRSTTGAPIVVERTMRWDATGYGSHTEKASEFGPGLVSYFAEGSQNDFFKTYFLMANPGAEANVAHVTYVRTNEPSLAVDYPLAPSSRLTIDAGAEPGLVGRAFGAVINFDRPAMAERSMYFGMNPLFSGGHASAGATAPATTWYLAEGATGSYFSTYVLLANPGTDPAQATVTFLPDSGVPVTKVYPLAGQQRLTLDIGAEDPSLVGTAVGTQVVSDLPIVVERSQYWPNPLWHEAHNSGGVTTPGTRWGLAEGRVGGASNDATYVLLANPGIAPVTATLRFLRTNATTVSKIVPVAATSRVTVGIAGAGSDVPELIDEAFGVTIDATGPIVVERSMYSSVNGVFWSAGTNATATGLP